MEERVITQLRQYISGSINERNIFDSFIEKCKFYYEQPAHSINEIKLKTNTKLKGDIFEHFAYLYYTYVKGWKVWFLKDLSYDLRKQLHLDKVDLGIDLIAMNGNKYYAIQVKYRKPNQRSKNVLGWKQLSTFLALVNRTGPWEKHIVFTNADYIRRSGMKSAKDWSVCIGTLRGIKRCEWESMLGYVPNKLSDNGKKGMTVEELREKRLKMLGQ